MKLHLLIGIMVSGALLAGLAAVGLGQAENINQQVQIEVFVYHGLVVFWLGVVGSLGYFYFNRER